MELRTLLFAFLSSLAMAGAAFGADNVPAAIKFPALPVKAPVISSGSACTPTNCSGWYVGGGLGGIGTNLDILGQGLAGSAFAGGMLPTAKFGYLYAQNGWLFGAEGTLAYQTSTTTTVGGVGGNQNGLLFTEGVKFGGNFQQLLGQTQSPLTVPPALANALINIYAQAGVAQHQLIHNFVTGEYWGAGFLLDTGAHSFVDVDYKNIQYGSTQNGPATFNSENIITASWNYKF